MRLRTFNIVCLSLIVVLLGVLVVQHDTTVTTKVEVASSALDNEPSMVGVPTSSPVDEPEVQVMAIEQVKPSYPGIARQASLEGTVLVQVLIGEDGRVHDVQVVSSDSPIFEEAATKAAAQWVFTPAMQNGKPCATRVRIPFKFSLKDAA